MSSEDHGRAPESASTLAWKVSEGQRVWTKIGLVFLGFYVGEAVLFWRGGWELGAQIAGLPLGVPLLYPLGFWGAFGATTYFLVGRTRPGTGHSPSAKRFFKWQGILLTIGITAGVVGIAFVVMKRSGDTTLGHVALFFAMFLAAAVIGAMEVNVGWLAAAGLWFLTALAIYAYSETWDIVPRISDEDILIGGSTALGFVLIGSLPMCIDQTRFNTPESKG